MNRSIKVQKLPHFTGREIAMSDIHGNFSLYQVLLKKAGYKPKADRLILVGDLFEKGSENLKLLRFIMKQKDDGENLWILKGNCDFTMTNILYAYRLDFIKQVLLERKHSLIHEMAAEIGLEPLNQDTYMPDFCYELRKHFYKELCFISDLPHILEGEQRRYTHAGFISEDNYGDHSRYAMTTAFFAEKSRPLKITTVCGHLPVTEYCTSIASYNVRFDAEKNIYSIDGGNMVKNGGQLNAIIFDGNKVSTLSADNLKTVRARVSTHPANTSPLYLTWNRGDLTLIEKGEMQSLVYSEYLNRSFYIDNSFLHLLKDHYNGFDYTSYEMPLEKGKEYSLVCLYHDRAQIKSNGILGWTCAENLDL